MFSEMVRNYGSRGRGVSARDNHVIKGMKAVHVLSALAWGGGALSMQALGFLKLASADPAFRQSVEFCRHFIDTWVVIPGLAGCVLTGLFYSTVTSIGFLKYLWIGYKWLISLSAAFWGMLFWGPWGDACITWLRPRGLETPLCFIRSCILPEDWGAAGMQLTIIFSIALISVYRPVHWPWHWRKATL